MSDMINILSGERLSFFKLFSEKKFRIVIPIIQRDYAQGRNTTKEIRDTFLEALYKYLDENKPNRDLDFVYGSLNEVNDVTDLILLDGQQRLTTLFLLHWYLCQISDNIEKKKEFKDSLLKDEKSMFTYETRSSSSEFCDTLMNNDIDFDNLLEADKDSKANSKANSLSNTIKNCFWFYLSWEYDPTIQSMLTMLDAIHNKFVDKKEYFERLLDIENPIITFLFLNLQDFKLTDDLYIKMNSRGKPLTPFENFKANFEQYLETINTDRTFTLTFEGTPKRVSLKEYFSYNIDTKWANLFWNYRTLQNRSNKKIDDTFDDELMNFIRVILSSQYAENVDIQSKENDYRLDYLLGTIAARKNKEYSDIISFNKYDELSVLSKKKEFIEKSKKYVLYLIGAFDSLVNGNGKIKIFLNENYKFYYDEDKTFKNALKHEFESNQQRLCFYAYVSYLINNYDNRSGIEQWMRVIHNLTHPENKIIDSASEVYTAIKSIKELLPHSNHILEHLKQNPKISLFSSWQVLEEKIKAYLITKDSKWKDKIETVEKHKYFNGQIAFILEFAGIIEYYKENKNCDWSDKEDIVYYETISDYAEKASKVFEESYDNRINDEDFIFERAVLTKGDYLTIASANRSNLLSANLVKNNIKRDHSWKRLLRISDDETWSNRRLLVKNVFDDERFNKDDLKKSLEIICKDKTNTWRDYFITCPSLIEYCRQGFIRFKNEKDILLYRESQSNHMHTEIYTYYLWKQYFKPNKYLFEPFNNVYYYEVKSIDEEPCIALEGLCYNKINYEIYIYFNDNDKLTLPYEICFSKSKEENLPEKYGSEMNKTLDKFNFQWLEEHKCYIISFKESDKLIKQLINFVNELKNL